MWMLVGTRWNRLAMVCERKKVGRSAKFYKKSTKVLISLSKTCFIFVWKIVRTPLPVIDKDNHLSKSIFISLFYKRKALAHAQSMLPSAKGLSFTFMLSHHLLSLCTTRKFARALLRVI
jgi:hypothetical protein